MTRTLNIVVAIFRRDEGLIAVAALLSCGAKGGMYMDGQRTVDCGHCAHDNGRPGSWSWCWHVRAGEGGFGWEWG